MTGPASERTRAILFMATAMMLFSILDAVAKRLGGSYSPAQIIFFKSLFQLLPVLFVVARDRQFGAIRTTMPGRQALRAISILFATGCWFTGLALVPLVDAFAIHQASPILMVVLARLFLGEPLASRGLLALTLGFVGALVIVFEQAVSAQSGATSLKGTGLIVVATILYAGATIMLRTFTPREAGLPNLFIGSTLAVVVSGTLLPWSWVTPAGPLDWSLFLLLGLLGAGGGLCLGQAFSRAPAAVVGPLEYTTMLWAILFGFVFFAEIPDPLILVGAGLIVAGGRLVMR